ncbi:MAG: NAD-dependent protein deacylase [Sphingobacteriales bacterium 17-39-43]|uniref:SIR2 family NAD-dependent protein deacylase n=1 Tax=Daejeonella sp. TaxID=2805397 RepID=UPI000BD5D721|nr:NAD-dependent deacylase [Daejeonella sp.]OYX99964.1 MAG: NAD-dependent protein deacylase [Sphingobacteriia bacterium 35-40-5]OYZ32871.1 MAG: NAD-dependent protein deacylase [Sphingobacteriales bacterium 16-39-50]OZA26281.1 MAG: NAD-dependent protein deacylase [Sphingobacteriales bacterium 17-39-43]OZA54432.1 MAG: NAD-dependent protein deacylase [Sphingobacteriales bacterium 39-40-5]HQS52046.1 NAD-dependent deacylase [Daejeonella sp.]
MKKVVVVTGAGISAESGLKTFRDSGGLWEGYNVYDVATPEAWKRDPDLVQHFYNERRKSVLEAEPNAAHYALVKLEEKFQVTIITQNIDDLHERAGSSRIIHLHGLITKSQSDRNPNLTYDILGSELKIGELCELGSQLRPHVVWFGEAVPMIENAAKECYEADIFIVIGTSLQVYPAAGLIDLVPAKAKKILVDPRAMEISAKNIEMIPENAAAAVPELVERLLNQ